MPDITLLIGAQDALRAGNATDTMRHISNFLVQSGCTGALDPVDGTLSHDGDTCPIHEGDDASRRATLKEDLLVQLRAVCRFGGAPDTDDLVPEIEDVRDALVLVIEELLP